MAKKELTKVTDKQAEQQKPTIEQYEAFVKQQADTIDALKDTVVKMALKL